MTAIKPDTPAAISFLEQWSSAGPWVITAIAVDRQFIDTQTFWPKTKSGLKEWLNKYNGSHNIYFTVNEVIDTSAKKAKKTNIKSAQWLHIDVDPDKNADLETERERCLGLLTDKRPKGLPEPTVIIFSGGGYQAFWRLEEPIILDGNVETCEEFELYNKWLEQILGGDTCHNVDRIMRLPGTINVPDPKKYAAGRREALAACILFNKKNRYDIAKFKRAERVQISGIGGGERNIELDGNVVRILDLSELDEYKVPDRIKIIIAQGKHEERPKTGDDSRSSWLFDVVCNLIRCGVPDNKIYAIITDKEWSIAESVVGQKDPHRYAVKQINSAHDFTIEPELYELNKNHCVVLTLGNKCVVMEMTEDPSFDNRLSYAFSTFDNFKNKYLNREVIVGSKTVKSGNNEIEVPVKKKLGHWWLEHPNRRQVNSLVFIPGVEIPGAYNLWQGFEFAPKPGDCSIFLDHLLNNVCSGQEEWFNYLIKWMARTVQFPGKVGEVAIVMRGEKGVGKSFVPRIFGKLFGRHYLQVLKSEQVTGQFNSHLRETVLLFADEAFFVGDKEAANVLKGMITEQLITTTAKGYDSIQSRSCLHIIMASNDEHVVVATGDERRYFVVEVNNNHKQDKVYFADMLKQMDNGGYEALLYHLQNIDLNGFQVRDVPETDALKAQKRLSRDHSDEWWFEKLQSGKLLIADAEWTGYVLTEALQHNYQDYADRWKIMPLKRMQPNSLGEFMLRVCPHREIKNVRYGARRSRTYVVGSLAECRKAWEDKHGPVNWEDDGEFNLDIKKPNEVM